MMAKIGARLAVTFSVILLLFFAVAITGNMQMARMASYTQSIANDYAKKVELSYEVKENTDFVVLVLYRAFYDKPDVQQSDIQRARDQMNTESALLSDIEGRLVSTSERSAFEATQRARAPYRNALLPVIDRLAALDIDGARAAMINVLPLRTAYVQAQNDFIKNEKIAMDAAVQEGKEEYSIACAVVWALSAVTLILTIVLGAMVTRSIVRPLRAVVEGASALAKGDLTVNVQVRRRDEVGEVAESLNHAIAQLGTIVRGVKQASESISSSSQQLSTGNTDLSQRTEEQAASLEETASSMEQLTATARQNADNAEHSKALATNASEIAQRGGQTVNRLIETMHGISDSSMKVAEITNIIEGIAFQTNILSLNAAVEAARAGDQGRGFAVVAGEVRALAQRSASAAKEIKALIGDSVKQVRAGTELVEEAGSTIDEVIRSVRTVTDIINEISSASEEQSTGIEQVNQAVSQMDQVTQQNAALVEEAAAATQSMGQQARELNDAVAVFTIADMGPSASQVVIPRSDSLRLALAVRKPPRVASANPKTTLLATAARSNVVDTTAADWQAF